MTNVYKQYQPPSSGGSMFLKLEDQKPVKVRIVSEPYIFTQEFQDNISQKYAWAVYNYTDDQGQILQLPVTGYRSIAALGANDDWGDPTGYDITVLRTGTGLDTKYSITPSPNKATLSPEHLKKVEEVDVKKFIKNAIPLGSVIDGAEVPAPLASDKKSLGRDVVPEDLPDEVDLSEIPF